VAARYMAGVHRIRPRRFAGREGAAPHAPGGVPRPCLPGFVPSVRGSFDPGSWEGSKRLADRIGGGHRVTGWFPLAPVLRTVAALRDTRPLNQGLVMGRSRARRSRFDQRCGRRVSETARRYTQVKCRIAGCELGGPQIWR